MRSGKPCCPRCRITGLKPRTSRTSSQSSAAISHAKVTETCEAESLDAVGLGLSDADLNWIDEQLDALLGAGPIERYLRRPDVENIYVFGPHRAVLGLSGGRQEHIEEALFANEDEMIRYVSHLATTHGQTGRRFDHSAPLLDLRLRTGERIFAAMAVCGTPYLTVRCHRHRLIRMEDLISNGSLSEQAGELLRAAVRPPAPANVLVCGALGSGKTTLLRALLAQVGEHEIVCTLEQTFELFLDESHPHTFACGDPRGQQRRRRRDHHGRTRKALAAVGRGPRHRRRAAWARSRHLSGLPAALAQTARWPRFTPRRRARP